MSMINDALRRASDAAKNSPEPPPLPVTPVAEAAPPAITPPIEKTASLCPLETQPRSMLPYILAILLFCCMAGAAVVYVWEKQKKTSRVQPVKPVVAAATIKSPVAANAEAKAPATLPSAPTPPATQPNAAATPVARPTPPAPAAAASANPAAAPIRFPPLRLQSIFYRPSNPSVMINGRTLFIDDEIQGVKVGAIDPSSVTLVLSGQTNVLTLR